MNVIEFEKVDFWYETDGEKSAKQVLKNVTFTIEEGEFVALLGHNGSGKSTAAKMINGLLLPEEGVVRVMGKDTADNKNLFEIRKNAGMVFQNPDNQMVANIVEDDVAFGPENVGMKREEIAKRIEYALRAVGMQEYRDATPSRLSGGQKQRVAIASVLALKPRIIILDESTSMLDPKGRKEVMDVVRALNKEEKITVLHITHFMDEALSADRVIVLDGGVVVMDGSPRDVFARREELAAFGLRPPRAGEIADQIKKNGIDIADGLFTDGELTEALCGYLHRD